MKDFLQNRPRVASPAGSSQGAAGASPSFDAALLGAMPGATRAAGGHDVSVEAIKEGDRVTKLIVTCRCGEKIEILCAYGPGPR